MRISDWSSDVCSSDLEGGLHLEQLGRGYAWLDTGTHQSLLEASNYIETIEARQGLRVCCPEEIAYNNGWIDAAQLEALARPLTKNGYGQYLLDLVDRGYVPCRSSTPRFRRSEEPRGGQECVSTCRYRRSP